MRSDYYQPLNLGQDRLISINGLADLVAGIAGVSIHKKHVAGPQGVRPQLRQLAAPKSSGLGATDIVRGRVGANVSVD